MLSTQPLLTLVCSLCTTLVSDGGNGLPAQGGAPATPGCAAYAQGTKQRDDANGREESEDRSREEVRVLVGDHATAA